MSLYAPATVAPDHPQRSNLIKDGSIDQTLTASCFSGTEFYLNPFSAHRQQAAQLTSRYC